MSATLSLKEARALSFEILVGLGVCESDAALICDSMEYADTRGKTTHGMGRIPLYKKNIEAGTLDPTAKMETVVDSGAVAVLDAHDGFGQIAAVHAIDKAVSKAREFGIAAVGVCNSNNFGAAGFYGMKCAQEGLICLVCANASPAFSPTGGSKALLGTNPICFAAPGAEGECPIVFDMAVTNVARSKIRLALKNGNAIPEGWALDKDGNSTTDPAAALEGTLLPVGGYKGYGLGLAVDILAGLLVGSPFAGRVKPLSDLSSASRNGHMFIVIDPARFCDSSEYEARISELTETVRTCGEDVMLPGERGTKFKEQLDGCIVLSDKQFDEIMSVRNGLVV